LAVLAFSNGIAMVMAEGPPSPSQVFRDRDSGFGHTFAENYWDINVYNNSYWEIKDPAKNINNMTTWLNNTWNIKWISEGNFEMGMFTFVNKTGDDRSATSQYFTPAQMWWMHYYIESEGLSHEMLIANMLSAWYGFRDDNGNQQYDEALDEEMTPFFYITQDTQEFRAVFDPLGVSMNTQVDITPIHRSVLGDQVIYTWGYNYTDIGFWLPHINHDGGATANVSVFNWGFNYSDPGTYMDGSFVFGVQEFLCYKYRLVLDNSEKKATLYNDYITGDIKQLYYREIQDHSNWSLITPGMPNYMPREWILCVGSWAFIMAGIDDPFHLHDTSGDNINAASSNMGLKTVTATVEGTNVFNYDFVQKPTYTQHEIGNPANSTTSNVTYGSMDIVGNEDFLSVVSGMNQLIGPFGRLVVSYAINQTNHFEGGIEFDAAWNKFDPSKSAAFFTTSYPKFGEYQGGRLVHDPVFTAFFTPGTGWGARNYDLYIILAVLGGAVACVVVIVAIKRKKRQ